jgi:hypothetical protein
MKKVFGAFARLCWIVVVSVIVLSAMMALAPAALADGGTAPALPSLEQLLGMSLRALGGLIFIALFGYGWGYLISALAARLAERWRVPSWVYDLTIVLPTAAVAAIWNAFAAWADVALPGALDKTVSQVLLWLVNAVFVWLFARRGGIAQVVDLARLGVQSAKAAPDATKTVSAARSGVLLVK